MSKNKKLKKAYRDLQIQEAPDLWERIESNLTPKNISQEEKPEIIHAEERKTKKNYRAEAGLAAAACCALLVLGGMMGRQQMKTGMTGAAETTAGQVMMEAETAAAQTTAAAETAVESGREEKNQMAAESVMPETSAEPSGQTDGIMTVSYDSLALNGTDTPAPPADAVYVPEDNYYFTEADLKDAGLLSQVTVENVSYENGPDGRADSLVYDVVVDNVLYSEDYVSNNQRLQVKSPLVGSGEENSLLYTLKEGGTYILPLKYEDGAYWLVYPSSPQIEVTEDMKYVFHTGWQSLVDDRTAVVLKNAESPEDFYYDRMVMRNDPVFLSNLTVLMEKMHSAG